MSILALCLLFFLKSNTLEVGKKAVKSHHNVGGLPEHMHLKVVEPLRLLFKDEVRRVGRSLGIGEELIGRHPFPGPGLAIRILGEITPERVEILQNVDKIYIDALREHGLYDQVWQAGVILLPVKSVGVMGDGRTYEHVIALRCVDSVDASLLDAFDYVALGHLHSPQKVGRDPVRYCGTPLKYSFSEADQHNSATFVEFGLKG